MTGQRSPSALRVEALRDLRNLRARHPAAFVGAWGQHRAAIAVVALLVGVALLALIQLDVSPMRILRGFGQLGSYALHMLPPSSGGRFQLYLVALGETLAIAFLGTLVAAILAFPVAFLAARNVVPNILVHFVSRRVFDVIRSVDVLIWALIWINVVGLGPFAGALAIACSDFGVFGKLFSEAIETADRRAIEGVTATGGSRLHEVSYGLVPQILPVIASQVLYYFESNTRSATIIGIVGAGGIGSYLTELIRTLELQQVAFLVLMILVTVSAIDFVSSRLRFAMIGRSPQNALA
ncbi:phosphonate ABC transporter, permease protein PhnE [uncultured Enterovirga sp.]|uniref:phosphonate ABC transporter, permease protein PhnE n=1 Tax=uncultured Enterovirga sp. TaxID=2026352 RepID=UPI0035CBA645